MQRDERSHQEVLEEGRRSCSQNRDRDAMSVPAVSVPLAAFRRSSSPLLDASPSFESISKYPEYYGETRSSSDQPLPLLRALFSSGILISLEGWTRSLTSNSGIMLFGIVESGKRSLGIWPEYSFDQND